MFHFINGMRIYHVMPGISNIQNIGIQGFEQLDYVSYKPGYFSS